MSDLSPTGLFIWHDLMSTDHESSIKFYQRLLGWNLDLIDMGEEIGQYRMFKLEDERVGGVVPLDPSQGHTSHWISYITVENVDETCEKMKALGGKVPYAPFDIPNVGRTAVAVGPTGAFFSPFKGISEVDSEPPAPRAGLFTWHELLSTNVEEAKSFYTDVMGWSLSSMDMGEAGVYWLFSAGDNTVAGAIQMPASAGEEATSSWMPYVSVTDVPQIAQKTKDLGGKVFVEPKKIGEPANVHFAVLAAPDGSMFGIVEI